MVPEPRTSSHEEPSTPRQRSVSVGPKDVTYLELLDVLQKPIIECTDHGTIRVMSLSHKTVLGRLKTEIAVLKRSSIMVQHGWHTKNSSFL